jgi:hypothetical protein
VALYAFSASLDLSGAGKGRRLASWALSQGAAGAQTVNLRSGGPGGPVLLQLQLAASSSRFQAFDQAGLPTFPAGLYVEVTGGGLNAGSVDLV